RVGVLSTEVVCGVVSERWSKDSDMVIALERLAEQAAFTIAESDGSLDATEEELFLFGRALDGSPELQMALTNPAEPAASKAAIVRDLLAGRSTPTTLLVLTNAVSRLHGERIDAVVEHLCELAARQRQRVVAEVRVAAPLSASQESRLAELLTRIKGRTVRLNVAIDPTVLGGVYARVGDEVIDGTVSSKLEQARRAVLG
ncbi:MAG: F0F1 ATP synthase subunit delta, partial [Solirubrobacterales bacterium]|nr:F0F1 ATP synthase subunit delta [Solirubrobacterales bacterium]